MGTKNHTLQAFWIAIVITLAAGAFAGFAICVLEKDAEQAQVAAARDVRSKKNRSSR